MSDRAYDAIVIGDSLTALTAATALANLRARTLWIPHERDQWTTRCGPYVFGIEDGLVTGLEAGGTFLRVCEATGIHPAMGQNFERIDPALQVITDDVRFEFAAHEDDLRWEAERELGADHAEGVLAYLRNMAALKLESDTWIPTLIRPDASAANAPAGAPEPIPDVLHPIVNAALRACTNAPDPNAFTPIELARTLGIFASGSYGPPTFSKAVNSSTPGDLGTASAGLALRRLLADREQRVSLSTLRGKRVEGIGTRWGKVHHVELSGGMKLGAEIVVAATQGPFDIPVNGWIGRSRWAAPELPTHRDYTLHVIVARRVIPTEFGRRTVLAGGSEGESTPVLVIREHIDEKRDRLSLVLRLDARVSPDNQRNRFTEALERLGVVLPYLETGIEGIFPAIGTQHDLVPDDKGVDPWSIVAGPMSGAAHVAHLWEAQLTTSIKNLLTVGAHTWPGLGLQGELLAGLASARAGLALLHPTKKA